MAKKPELLRQIGSGHIYHYTDALAKRSDMVPCDPHEAEIRIKAAQERLKALQDRKAAGRLANEEVVDKNLQKAAQDYKKLSEIEAEIGTLEEEERIKAEVARKAKEAEARGEEPAPEATPEPHTEEEKEEAHRQKIIKEDSEIAKFANMTKAEIDLYLQENYGIKTDLSRTKLEDLKDRAIDERVKRVLELEEANR